MQEMVLSFDNLRDKYPEDRYIMLLPVVSKHMIANRPMYSLDVSTVKIDPDDPKMVYTLKSKRNPQTGEWEATEVGLSKVALDLLCAAADIDVETEPVGDLTNKMFRIYRARAEMQTPGGTVRGRTAMVEWDGETVRDRLQMNAEDYVRKAVNQGWKSLAPCGKPWKDLTPEEQAAEIEARFRRTWIDERDFGKRKAESKAARNALRSILAMKASYDPRILRQKEFAVAKLVLTPDMNDPVQRQAVIQAGIGAMNRLYGAGVARTGGGLFLPAGAAPATRQLATTVQEMAPANPEPADVPGFDPPEPEPQEATEATAPANLLKNRQDLVVVDTWDDAETLIPSIEAELRDWTGDDGLKDQMAAFMVQAGQEKNTKGIEYLANYIIKNGGSR